MTSVDGVAVDHTEAMDLPELECEPVTFTDIIIPSKSRADARRATWHLLLADKIPFTVVVEPQDAAAYRASLAAQAAERGAAASYRIVELPLNDQGVTYARNFILDHVAPRVGWYWIMDDDIHSFGRAVNQKVTKVTAAELLSVVGERMGRCANLPFLGMFALEYQQFSYMYDDDAVYTNGYCNIAVCQNRERMPPGIRYRFRVREDYDFALQMIKGGFATVRFRNLSFTVPMMGSKPGGMTPYYEAQKRDIRVQNKLFLEAWGHVAEEVRKGTGASERYDIRVRWTALSVVDEAAGILNAVQFNGFSSDPLATTLAADAKKNGAANVKKEGRRLEANATRLPDHERKRGRPRKTPETITPADEKDSGEIQEDPRRRSQPPPSPPEKQKWKGWSEIRFRITDPDLVTPFGLKRLSDPPNGTTVAFVPIEVSRPVLVIGTVIGRNNGSVTVVPQRRGEPVSHVEHVYAEPNETELPGLLEALAEFYSTHDGES